MPKEQSQGFMDMFERLSWGSWIQHAQCGSRYQETWVGGRREDRTGSRQPEVEAMCTCACYCKLGVLLGGTPGFSSKSKNSWESKTHENTVGVFSLDVIYFPTKINIFQRFHHFKDGEREGKYRHLQRVN